MGTKKCLAFLLAVGCFLGAIYWVSKELWAVTETTELIPNQVMYPDDLLKFHIERQKGDALFVLTVYKIPYHNHFQFMYLTNSDELWIANDFSQRAIRGSGHGEITAREKESLINSLDSISHSSMPVIQNGEYVLTLSYDTPDGVLVFTCQNKSCPIAMCSMFELADTVFKRNQDAHNFSISCPVEGINPK